MAEYKVNIGPYQADLPGSDYRVNIGVFQGGVAPVITGQPVDVTTPKGQLASFTITATGLPAPSYQWYKDDIEMSGETSSTLSFYAAFSDAGTYKCRVYNVAGELYSNPATLTVITNPWRYNLFKLQSDVDRS